MNAPLPLISEAFAGGWPAALVVLAGMLILCWYAVWGDALYVRAVEALTGWWDARREARRAEYVEKVVTAAEVAGIVPVEDPWADVLAAIKTDPFLTPVAEDDCDVCNGTGIIGEPNPAPGSVFKWTISCWSCDGSGVVGGAA